MKEIFNEYGRLILTVFAGFGIFVILFSGLVFKDGTKGVFLAAGKMARLSHKGISCEHQILAWQHYFQTDPPQIRCLKSAKTGCWISRDTIIQANDQQEKRLSGDSVRLRVLPDEDLPEVLYRQDGAVCFQKAGTYRIRVMAKDQNGRQASCICRIHIKRKKK